MTHAITGNTEKDLIGIRLTCACGEMNSVITDTKFFTAVVQRHLNKMGIDPFRKDLVIDFTMEEDEDDAE